MIIFTYVSLLNTSVCVLRSHSNSSAINKWKVVLKLYISIYFNTSIVLLTLCRCVGKEALMSPSLSLRGAPAPGLPQGL